MQELLVINWWSVASKFSFPHKSSQVKKSFWGTSTSSNIYKKIQTFLLRRSHEEVKKKKTKRFDEGKVERTYSRNSVDILEFLSRCFSHRLQKLVYTRITSCDENNRNSVICERLCATFWLWLCNDTFFSPIFYYLFNNFECG